MAKVKDLKTAEKSYVYFYGKASPFSQFHPCMFSVDGQTYSCAEQYMMHQKAVVFKDDKIGQQILECKLPLKMKRLGRKVKNYDDKVWNQHCVKTVKKGNMAKFSQNSDLKAKLFATKGKVLAEASPRDRKWGIGMSSTNPLAWSKSTWKGKNLLGYAITEVRDELMRQEELLEKQLTDEEN